MLLVQRAVGQTEAAAHRRNGQEWPVGIADKWRAWSRMPHAALWHPSDWEFALDTLEIAATLCARPMRTALVTELRYRERVMGTTWDARRNMRVRYVDPVAVKPSAVMRLDAYRNL